jgi:hypothetical protein
MPSVGWFHGSDLLRVDDLPREWCPWHVVFYCELCGEVWLKRLHLSAPAVYTYRPAKCPSCTTSEEYFGLPIHLLNHNELSAGYAPVEILALEFLTSTTELPSWLTLQAQQKPN